MSEKIENLVIVGSGPAGYTAAIYAARALLSPIVYEGSVTAGGALMNTTEVENFPGFVDAVMGPDLMDSMRKQAKRFGAQIVTDDIVAMNLTGAIKILFRDQVIAVVGGGDSAVEEASFLTRFASKVILIHRRDSLRASKIMVDRAMANPKIEFLWNTEVIDVLGSEKVAGLKLRNTVDGSESIKELTGLFVAIGHTPRSELITAEVALDGEGYVTVDGTSTRTNLAGVFACGDLVDHTYRQAITAAGSGCQAALDAEKFLAHQ